MDISCIVVASCDPPPEQAAFDEARDDVEELVEEAIANWLLDHNAGFAIRTTWKVDP